MSRIKDATKTPDLSGMVQVPVAEVRPVPAGSENDNSVGPTPTPLSTVAQQNDRWRRAAPGVSRFAIFPLPPAASAQLNATVRSAATSVAQATVAPIQTKVDALASQFQATGFQGAWSASIYYAVDAQVTYGGEFWTCISANANNIPSSSPSFWTQLSGSNPYLGTWSSATTYAIGDQVSYLGNFYIAIASSTNQTPVVTSSAYWTLLGTSVILIGTWSSGQAYVQGNQVIFSGNIYQCILANTNQTPPNATYWQLLGPATLDNLADGTQHFSATASTLTYRPTTNPLTANDAGASATINIASFTMLTSSKGSISVNSGSITTLSYGTLYYVYYDDPTLAGGSVTFHATTTKTTAINGAGRFFVGSITTPPSGGSNTTGNNDGGAGAQDGQFLKVFFSEVTIANSTAQATVTNPTNANDGSDASFAASKVQPTGGSGGNSTVTVSLPMVAVYSFESAVLNIKTAVPTNGAGTSICELRYSLDGGSTWTNIFSLAANTTRALTVDSVSLTSPLNLGRIQVQSILQSGPAQGFQELDFYEAWIEVTA